MIGSAPCVVMANPATPVKTMADIVKRLNAACNAIMASAEFKKRMLDPGINTSPRTPTGFIAFARDQVAALSSTVKGAAIKL